VGTVRRVRRKLPRKIRGNMGALVLRRSERYQRWKETKM
jgi:hypothetical protein